MYHENGEKMRIIVNYIVREYMKIVAMAVSVFIMIFLVVDFFERIGNIIESKVSFWTAITYFLYKIPFIVVQVLPVALLVGVVVLFSTMGRNREIVALKSAGVSLFRLLIPIFSISLIMSLFMFWLNELVIPLTNSKARKIWKVDIKKERIQRFFRLESLWIKDDNNIYHIHLVDINRNMLHGVTLYRFDKNRRLKERIDARDVELSENYWIFLKGVYKHREKNGEFSVEHFKKKMVKVSIGPADLYRERKHPEAMSYSELKRYVHKLRLEGYDPTSYVVDMQAKIAFPFTCVILSLIGFYFALRKEKGEGLILGLGISIAIAFVYWVVFGLGISLGKAEILPPLLAVWFPNLLFGLTGFYLLLNIPQ